VRGTEIRVGLDLKLRRKNSRGVNLTIDHKEGGGVSVLPSLLERWGAGEYAREAFSACPGGGGLWCWSSKQRNQTPKEDLEHYEGEGLKRGPHHSLQPQTSSWGREGGSLWGISSSAARFTQIGTNAGDPKRENNNQGDQKVKYTVAAFLGWCTQTQEKKKKK